MTDYDENVIKAFAFIAVYTAFKIKRKITSSFCIALITTNAAMKIEDDSFYMNL